MQPFFVYESPSGGQVTTDAYADVQYKDTGLGTQTNIIRALTSGPTTAQLVNQGANSLTYKILGSNNLTLADAQWPVVKTDTPLASGLAQEEDIDLARFLFYKILVKATTPGSQSTLFASVVNKRF